MKIEGRPGEQWRRTGVQGEEVLRNEMDQIVTCMYEYVTMDPTMMYNYNTPLKNSKNSMAI